MSETPSVPVETATGVSVDSAASNVADDADKHTPPTDAVAPPKDTVTDPSDADASKDDLREMVTGLATQVATLTDLVMAKAAPDQGAGEKLPWALRGKREL